MLDEVKGDEFRKLQELLLVRIREEERRVERAECPECEGEGNDTWENRHGHPVHGTCRDCDGSGRVFIEKEESDEG